MELVKVKILNGFTDSKNKEKNYQDGEITEISKDRFKELEGIYVEKYEEPVIEKDNGALQAEIDKLKEEKENTNKEESPKKSKLKSDESVEDGKVQE